MSAKKGLGRGFDSLIPTDLLDDSFDPTATQDAKVSDLKQIKISEISPDPDQPRRQFEKEAIEELADSIREHGILQPIVVTPAGSGYQIVAGERRYRASKLAGLEKIPALVRTLSGQHKLELSLIENLQRKDLNVIETATAYAKLRDQFNLNLEQIGQRVGKRSVSAVSNTLRLLKLPASARQALAEGKLSEGQARPLIGLDEKLIDELVGKIAKEHWSARQIEQYIVNLKKQPKSDKKQNNSPYVQEAEELSKKLGTQVKIQSNAKGAGSITIKFKSEEELRNIKTILDK